MKLGRSGWRWVLGSFSVLALAVFAGNLSKWCPIRLHNYLYFGDQAGECVVEEGSVIELEEIGTSRISSAHGKFMTDVTVALNVSSWDPPGKPMTL